MNSNAVALRNLVKGVYDIQDTRIAIGNRIISNFYLKIENTCEDRDEDKDNKFIDSLTAEYNFLNEMSINKSLSVKKILKEHNGLINTVTEYELMTSYSRLLESEKDMMKVVVEEVKNYPMWGGFLEGVKGIGCLMAAVLISELDPHLARHVSCYWSYCGYDVVIKENEEGDMIGEGRSRRKEHLIERTYIDKNGNEKSKLSVTYNPNLKSKMFVIGACLLRARDKYAEIYRNYKFRLENNDKYRNYSKNHKHLMAIRYMNKMFLRDYWKADRVLAGLPIDLPYEVQYLGKKEHGA